MMAADTAHQGGNASGQRLCQYVVEHCNFMVMLR